MTVGSDGSRTFNNPPLVGTIFYNTTASLLWSFCTSVENRLLCTPHNRCILSLSILTNLKFVYWERYFTTLQRSNLSQEFCCRLIWNNDIPCMLTVKRVKTVAKATAIRTIVLVVGWIPNTLCA